ncbi:MAG TPA: O-antigen ligase family protein, partial [Patescibacteria group bacterium]|nr:O-antigen ligase family protein [Patescibacteria group bacterium]
QFAPAQISATFGNPVYYGAFCIMPFALAVYLAWQSKSKWQKSLYGFMGFMQIVALNLTAARGATLGLLFAIGVAGILFFYFIRSPKIRSGIIAGLGLFTVLMLVAVLSPNFAKENVLIARLKVAANDPNLNMRMELWRMAYQGFKESPKAIFLGHGQENFPYAFNRYYEAEMYERDLTERQDKPHEFYLELLYSFGIFGFLVFMGLIAVFYWSLWQLRKREMLNLPGFIILSSGFAGYLLQYLAFFETTSPTVFYYIFFSTPIAWLALKDSVDTKKKLDLATSLLVAGGALIAVFIVLYYTVLSPSYLSRLQGKAAYALSVDKKVDQAFAYLEEIANDDSNFDKPAAAIRAMETTLALKNAVASGTQLPMDVVVKFEKLVIDTWEKLDLKYWNNSEHLGFYLWFKTIYSEDTNTPIDSNLDHLVERMQALGPEKAESYSYAAMYYKRKGDMQKAFDNAQKAISLNKDDGQSAWLTYQILRAAGKNDEAATTALSVMQRQLRFSPTNDDLVWLTSYLLDKKQYGPAGQLAGSLMQAKAGVPEIYPVVIRFLRETGKSEDATKVIEEAKKRFPQNQAIQSLK